MFFLIVGLLKFLFFLHCTESFTTRKSKRAGKIRDANRQTVVPTPGASPVKQGA